ncbi:hypothetical protein ACFFHJ_35025 [Planotetraspora thailandica]|uniref:hypothetical protein n=1 Tax=Planotetraspora thailandica TaxID=487172 RepID=UPI00195257E6|nr:hypothetical protein [Planotetraspora thailandica]
MEKLGGAVPDLVEQARAALAKAEFGPRHMVGVSREAEPSGEPVVMAPVLQLFERDAPGIAFADDSDLVQVLWCPAQHASGLGPRPVVFWRRVAEIDACREAAPALNRVFRDSWVPLMCVVHPESVLEFPPICTLEDETSTGLFGLLPASLETRIREWDAAENLPEELSYVRLAHAPGWKVGGWEFSAPEDDALVDCACGAPMRPLLETYSNEELAGPWSPSSGPDFVWGDPENWTDQEPTGVKVARNGALWIRICSVNPRHPIDVGLF